MIDELTPESVASEVRLLREDADYRGVFLFVEGDTDSVFFSNYVDGKKCIIRFVKGRDNVLRLIEIIETAGETCSLAIIDADFWHIERKNTATENILVTDTHDIETMIFKSSAFEKVISEFVTQSAIESTERRYHDIRSAILSVAYQMAIIRWINHRHKFGICFYANQSRTELINWEPAIDIDRFSVDFERLLDIVCSDNYSIKIRMRPYIRLCRKEKYDPYEFCNGHDVIFVTLLFIKRRGRRGQVENLLIKDLERIFRLAYEISFFKTTRLYENMLAWQQKKGINFLKI